MQSLLDVFTHRYLYGVWKEVKRCWDHSQSYCAVINSERLAVFVYVFCFRPPKNR